MIGNPKGVERDLNKLERRRLKAARLLNRSLHQVEVARRLDIRRQSVSRRHEAWNGQGTKALRKAARAGRKPRLQPVRMEELRQGLKEGPEALWATERRSGPLGEGPTGVKYVIGRSESTRARRKP